MKLTEREKLILKEERNNKIKIDLEDDLIEKVSEFAKQKEISVEDFIYISIVEHILNIEKSKIKEKNVYDIYDMWNIEEIIKELEERKEIAIIIDGKGNKVVLIPQGLVS